MVFLVWSKSFVPPPVSPEPWSQLVFPALRPKPIVSAACWRQEQQAWASVFQPDSPSTTLELASFPPGYRLSSLSVLDQRDNHLSPLDPVLLNPVGPQWERLSFGMSWFLLFVLQIRSSCKGIRFKSPALLLSSPKAWSVLLHVNQASRPSRPEVSCLSGVQHSDLPEICLSSVQCSHRALRLWVWLWLLPPCFSLTPLTPRPDK